jgi:methionyl-tRNA synthetase
MLVSPGLTAEQTLGNVIDPDLLAKSMGGNASVLLMSDMVIGQERTFEFRIIERHDGDLANSVGNLLNRT